MPVILNAGCGFTCNRSVPPGLPLPLAAVGTGPTYNGLPLLTEACRTLSGTFATCATLTEAAGGVPTPCMPVLGLWQKTSRKMTCKGSAVLTDSSFCICTTGQGRIAPVPAAFGKPTLTAAAMSGFMSTAAASATPRRAGSIQAAANVDAGTVPSEGPAAASKSELPARSGPAKTSSAPHGQKKAGADESGSIEADRSAIAPCGLDLRDECTNCLYSTIRVDEASVNNSSTALAANYDAAHPDREAWFQQIKAEVGSDMRWSRQMHHLIPGNEVLVRPWSEPSRQLLFYGYNVNEAENGIPLMGPEMPGARSFASREDTDGADRSEERKLTAWEAMHRTGIQWHSGRHTYQVSGSLQQLLWEYYKVHCHELPDDYAFPSENANYCAAVLQELQLSIPASFQQGCPEQECWMERRHERGTQLKENMRAVSDRIRERLNAFGRDPQDSFPFYVSKTAMEYAFRVMRKLVLIYPAQDGARAARASVSFRPRDDGAGAQIHVEGMSFLDAPLDAPGFDQRTFIRFCENATHFLLDPSTEYALPFAPESAGGYHMQALHLPRHDLAGFLESPAQFAYLTDMFYRYVFPDQSVIRTIKQREGHSDGKNLLA